jgi:hypothetical protein
LSCAMATQRIGARARNVSPAALLSVRSLIGTAGIDGSPVCPAEPLLRHLEPSSPLFGVRRTLCQAFALFRVSQVLVSLTHRLPRIPKQLGPELRLLYCLGKLGEAGRNCPRTNLVALSKMSSDFGADLLLFP